MVNNNNNLGRIIFVEAKIGKKLQKEKADEVIEMADKLAKK